MALTKEQLIKRLEELGVKDFDKTATNAALEALIAKTEAEQAADTTPSDDTTTDDSTPDTAPETPTPSDDAVEEEPRIVAEATTATFTRNGRIVKTYSLRLDGKNWQSMTAKYQAQNPKDKLKLS